MTLERAERKTRPRSAANSKSNERTRESDNGVKQIRFPVCLARWEEGSPLHRRKAKRNGTGLGRRCRSSGCFKTTAFL